MARLLLRLSPSLSPVDLWESIPDAWRVELDPVRADVERIEATLSQAVMLPSAERVFRALEVPPDAVSVLIVGQDPYPNPEHACGLAFSVPPGADPLPASLRTILREVADDVGPPIAADGDLSPWVDQGVLLLNRSLTVQQGLRGSHSRLGWHAVTDEIVRVVARRSPGVVALLWGAHAQQVAPLLPENAVVRAPHPSPLSAHRGFLGSRPFSQANMLLAKSHRPPIRW